MTTLKPRLYQLLVFITVIFVSVSFLVFSTNLILTGKLNFLGLGGFLYVLLSLLGFIPAIYISITYFYVDLTKKVILDEQNHHILIKRMGETFTITKNDIVESYLVIGSKNAKLNLSDFKYVMIILKERKRVCITSLLSEPEKIVSFLNLNPTVFEKYLPLIHWKFGQGVLTSTEFESKVKEFENNFQNLSDKDLSNVILNKGEYAEYAREAAKRISRKRKIN
jgi:hypothetical protein